MGNATSPEEKKWSLGNLWNRQRGPDYVPVDEAEDNEYTSTRRTDSTDGARRTTPRRRRCLSNLTSCSIWGLVTLASILLITLLLSIARSLWGLENNPDLIFGNWGKPGSGTEGLAWYPTDFLRDVVPIRCHSHNDYWRTVPLFSALHAGCVGVEADVWLMDDGPVLYVGHDEAALAINRTFQSLYINPLVDLLNRSNPQTQFYNESRRGVFDYDPEQPVILLVDIKTGGNVTWPHVLSQLEPLRSRGYLTYFSDGEVHQRQVTVVGTGATPFDLVVKNSTYRDVFFDAPLEKMWEDPDDPNSQPAEEAMMYNETNSFYASTSFVEAIGIGVGGLSQEQLYKIRGQIKGAHRRGLKVRYWETMGWPIGWRNIIWHTLIEEGIDFLNVDDLKGATKTEW
ncbi:PLC-like phosphodiesterase [Hypoxylon trugodes]|uniref:PLC-like phosphodiesterase n=1 Tax=Hypoxylon trugodes TaxID=326681 RepID=UPI00218FFAE4|nr:PLC-like phosphodiesterase [Hypoxylon trugodes]KAI1391424.1 PLC-like phosphodiesterase [Hypoxylon trugodes]